MKTILEDEMTASRADIKNTVIADLSQIVSDKVDNFNDYEERKLDIILFGVVESASNLKKTGETKMTPRSSLKLAKMKLKPT